MTIVKEQIVIMSLDLFSQYGIKSVSMDDIARNVGISKRTLYGFFEDKETLLTEGLRYIQKQTTAFLEELEKGPYTVIDIIMLFYQELMKRPRWYSQKFYDDLNKYPKALAVKEEDRSTFADRCSLLFNRGIKEEVFQKEVNFDIMTLLAKEQLKMIHPSKTFAQHSNIEVYSTVLFTFLRGISTDKGREILDRWYLKKQLYDKINYK